MSSSRSPLRTLGAVAVATLSAGLVVVGALGLAGAAQADFVDVPPTGNGRLILAADPYPAAFLDISPGDPAYWQVSARLQDASHATLSLQLRKDGGVVTHPRGLTLTVDECREPWSGIESTPACASGSTRIAVRTPTDDDATSSPTFVLASLTGTAQDYLLVTLAVEDSAAARADASLMGLTGSFGLGVTAVNVDGEPVSGPAGSAGAAGPLAATGFDPMILLATAALAAGLLGLGAAFRIVRRAAPSPRLTPTSTGARS